MHTFPGDKCIYIGVGINSVSFNYKGKSQGLNLGRAEVDTRVFLFVANLKLNVKSPYWVSVGEYYGPAD